MCGVVMRGSHLVELDIFQLDRLAFVQHPAPSRRSEHQLRAHGRWQVVGAGLKDCEALITDAL